MSFTTHSSALSREHRDVRCSRCSWHQVVLVNIDDAKLRELLRQHDREHATGRLGAGYG